MNAIDSAPFTTIAAVHGVTFGGGLELALTCDIVIAGKTARFCFPELRLGLIPGFGGIPRLKRAISNAVVRDLVLTGRSFNAAKAQQIGLVSQLVSTGEALRIARATAAQLSKFDRYTVAAAKRFVKPIPVKELREEIEIVCDLYTRPVVETGLRMFVESTDALPYLPLGGSMTNLKETTEHILDLAATHFNVPRAQLTEDDDIFEKLGIDSLKAQDLLTSIENHFHVELPDYEMQDAANFRTLAERIQARL